MFVLNQQKKFEVVVIKREKDGYVRDKGIVYAKSEDEARLIKRQLIGWEFYSAKEI